MISSHAKLVVWVQKTWNIVHEIVFYMFFFLDIIITICICLLHFSCFAVVATCLCHSDRIISKFAKAFN